MANQFSALPRILVIEDSPFEQRMLVDILDDYELDVAVAEDGSQGYDLAQALKPDLILMDVAMPGVDGLACCRLLRATPTTADIPVVFLSGSAEPEERLKGLDAGAVDYIGKPFLPEELVARIRIHLRLAGRTERAVPPPPGIPGDSDHALVAATKSLVEGNLQLLPGLSSIASQLGTYRERLTQVFRRETGVSVFEFARELRIQRSKELLRETDLDVGEIASLVGFQSSANFATAFRGRTGVTPRQFRSAQKDAQVADEIVLPAVPIEPGSDA